MSKFLILGFRGFIGTRLCQKLTKEGIDFVGYDLQDGDDVRDKFKLDKIIESGQFDMVVHLAAQAGVRRGEDFPDEFISMNMQGTQNVVNACKKHGVRKILFYSSSSVLGGNDEPDQVGLDEMNEYNPKSIYAMTKVAGECIVKNSGLDYLIIRPFTVYGENGRPDMVIYKWINQIKAGRPITFYGDGKTKRGYTYVQDLVDATITLAKMKSEDKDMPGILHLGGSEIITLAEVLQLFDNHCKNNNIEYFVDEQDMPKADVTSSFACIDEAREAIGFEPQKRFKNLIKQILNEELKGD